MNRYNKRSAIVTPIKYNQPRFEANCQICLEINKVRWASSICTMCNLFICTEHMKIIRDKSYCQKCRNQETSSKILNALESTEKTKNYYCCFYY